MNIGLFIFSILSILIGGVSTIYIVASMFGVLGWKIYRKLRYGMKLTD